MCKRVSAKQIAVLLGGATLVLSGCTVDVYSPPPREHVYVEQEPPPPPPGGVYVAPDQAVVEEPPPPQPDVVVGVAPGPDYGWVGGEYIIVGGRYQWRGGHWDRHPVGHGRWVAGGLRHGPHGYVHVEGHWE